MNTEHQVPWIPEFVDTRIRPSQNEPTIKNPMSSVTFAMILSSRFKIQPIERGDPETGHEVGGCCIDTRPSISHFDRNCEFEIPVCKCHAVTTCLVPLVSHPSVRSQHHIFPLRSASRATVWEQRVFRNWISARQEGADIVGRLDRIASIPENRRQQRRDLWWSIVQQDG
jgi:hypothetical protein